MNIDFIRSKFSSNKFKPFFFLGWWEGDTLVYMSVNISSKQAEGVSYVCYLKETLHTNYQVGSIQGKAESNRLLPIKTPK